MSLIERLRRALARIWIRLLAFNVLLVFLPLIAVSYLDTYERQLLDRQERSMVQQGRLIAAALGGRGELDERTARQVLAGLRGRTSARLRVLDRDGMLLADTSRLGPAPVPQEPDLPEAEPAPTAPESWLYRIGALPFRLGRRWARPELAAEAEFYAPERRFSGPEVDSALSGRYGAATRVSAGGQRSMTLYSAIPIVDEQVVGAALVSQSTFQILQDLYEIRLDLFRIFLVSVAAAIVLSLVVSTTIVGPIRRLRREATSLLDARGRLTGLFARTKRRDEIGELGRDLRELARRLKEQQERSETFAADLAHEFRNPLASIRGATEVLADLEDPRERSRFVAMIESDAARLERLLTGIRELSSIDAGRASDDGGGAESCDLATLVPNLIEGWKQRHLDGRVVECTVASGQHPVDVPLDRVAQIMDNLLDNADGFAPPRTPIEVSVGSANGEVSLAVCDHGPGIPPEHRQRVFDRFFSDRPEECSNAHTGLGLAIVKAIAESCGGSAVVGDAHGGGAMVSVKLRRADVG